MKTCTECGRVKPLELFPPAKTCVDGRRSYCRDCYLKRKSLYYERTKSDRAAWQKAWAAKNPEKVKAAKRKYNRKAIASGTAAASRRNSREKKPEKYRAYVSARRTKLRKATPPWVDMRQIRAVYEEATRKGLTVDHIIPINGKTVSGLHVPWNLQLMSLSDNSRKRNRVEFE